MSKEKTIEDVIDLTQTPFKERALGFEEEVKSVSEKWGVALWAGLVTNNEAIVAVPQLKDLWEKKEEDAVPAS